MVSIDEMGSPIRIDGYDTYVLSVVRGLKSEADKVSSAFEQLKPQILAMSISPEEIKGLKAFIEEPFEVEMSRYEELYAARLSKFGDVFLPPPCFLAGLEEADKAGADLIGIDMDDETHTTAYCALVSGRDLFVHSTRFKIVKMKSFRAKTPAEFAIAWDRKVNNLKGFRELEREREAFMSKELMRLSSSGKKVLALIDTERANGVRKILTKEKKN